MDELIFVDDRPCSPRRPCSLNYALFNRPDICPILLRVFGDELDQVYIEETRDLHRFQVNLELGPRVAARQFRSWCSHQALSPQHLCCMSEPRQEFWQAFARELGVHALSADSAHALRDKPTMKEWIRGAGLRTADFARISGRDDALRFEGEFGYPLIVKPVDGWGALATQKLCDRNDLDRIVWRDFNREMMIETFIPDREYECCALIANGEVLDIFPSIMPAAPMNAAHGAINANISVGAAHHWIPVKKLKHLVQRLVEKFCVTRGYLHMEFFSSDDGARVTIGELALRYPGCEIAKNHGLACGFDIANATLDIYLGCAPSLRYTKQRCVGDLLLPYRAGQVRHFTDEAELLKMPGVIEAHLGVRVGEVLPLVPAASFNCSGWVIVEGATPTDVKGRMLHVLEHFEIGTDGA